ncbi:GNAT family N-acetyltransferase [Streptomyces sp. NPDC096105]|uniref:GNAT family N-acetyltransferase n=1 Tax=Streptomyces sp. NPDC096105 TaxID=3366074 RepID=UPI00380A5BAA
MCAYWWGNSTSSAARRLRRAYDALPGARVGWDSHSSDGGPSISYAGLQDGVSHVLAPMEKWRQRSEGGTDERNERRGGRRTRALAWARGPGRGDLIALGLYGDEAARHDLGRHLVAPLRIHYLIHLDNSPEAFLARFGKKDRENIRRGLRKHDWNLERTGRPEDFDLFYTSMHVPTMAARHQGWVRSERRDVAEHVLFRRGLLFFLRRGSERVAGVLCRVEGGTLVIRLAGVMDGDARHYRDGAQLMLYHLVMRWAIGQGIRRAELSGSRPFISEGLYAFKRKFRPQIVVPKTHFADKRLILAPRRDTAEVRDFLRDHPIITVNRSGELRVAYPYDRKRPPRTDLPWDCSGISGAQEIDLDCLLAGLPGPAVSRRDERRATR